MIIVVSDVLAKHYYSHSKLNSMFVEAGAPGEPPEGNCQQKCESWFKRANANASLEPFEVLGGVLTHFMEYDGPSAEMEQGRKRITEVLRKNGLTYHTGGKIFGASVGAPSRSLDTIIRGRDLPALETEFGRATASVETDPPTAVTAACAILESLFKIYIEDEKLTMPDKQTVKPLWQVVQKSLGLDPKTMEDDDLARILGGLSSVVDGIGAWRTHGGSAHGKGRQAYRAEPRHARLAIHAAHTLATFLIETWDARRATKTASPLAAPSRK